MPELEALNLLMGSGASGMQMLLIYVVYRHEMRIHRLENPSRSS